MKKLLFILLFIPLISLGQENVLNRETIKDEYIKTIDGIIYYNGKPYTGVFYRNYENGKLNYKTNWKDGKRDGPYENYYEDGQLNFKANYKDGKLDGLWEKYYEDGQLEWKINYKDGKRDGLKEEYYENGKLHMKENYKADFNDGLFEYYYENGMLKQKVNWKDGKLDGLSETYYENGQLAYKYLFENNVFIIDLRYIIGETDIRNVNVYDLEPMIKLFLKDCKLNNIKLSSDYKITSIFEPLNDGVLALSSGIFNDEEIIIKVNPKEWSGASNPKRWYILYHELGHDVLNLQHGQGGKMMFNYTEKDYTWDEFFKDRDYMFNSMKSK
jgi:antitoxin component YwqK of YwqJK toxin-antitoxin module